MNAEPVGCNKIRNHKELLNERFDDERVETASALEQVISGVPSYSTELALTFNILSRKRLRS